MAWSFGVVGAPAGLQDLALGVPLRGVARYALFSGFLAASLMFYVWSRGDAQATSAELDLAVRSLKTAKVETGLLELELASRRNLAGLKALAQAEGWVRMTAVVVPQGSRP
jgi:hypothetical protein